MNRKEIINEINFLDKTATHKNKAKNMESIIKGKKFTFHFVGENDSEELIAIFYKDLIFFADSVKANEGELFFKQNGAVFVAKIKEGKNDLY